ncbi:MAG: cyclopropane-fatty-acyl-phospholipid synthase family protein, partial [Acidobacteriota bacterium]
VVLGGSIGAAEAYMAGHWSADDLTAVLRFFLLNRQALDNLEDGSGRLKRPLYKVFGYLRANTRQGSRRNIQAHYDLSNEFFELFLDRRMMYSSAIFEPDTLDLDAASELKLDRLCRKLDLRPQDHLLEIGTGWGGFAVYAAETYGCRVTTTTISPAQHAKAVERVRAAGLEDRITVLLQDYRDLGGRYDKLVSIEMIEAVGLKFLDGYFQRCAELLAPGGVMAIQGITLADRNFEAYRGSVDFIQRYIFPGSSLVSVATLANSASRTDLQIVHLEDIGPHYARTLREWRLRFFERIEDVRALGFSERFERLWDYYLCYCEAGFEERVIGDVQVVLSKPSNRNRPILGDLEAATPAS